MYIGTKYYILCTDQETVYMYIGTRYYILCTDQETVCTLGLDITYYVQIKKLYVHWDYILHIMYRSRNCMYVHWD